MAAVADVTVTATTREKRADFVTGKRVLWRKAANSATRLAEKSGKRQVFLLLPLVGEISDEND